MRGRLEVASDGSVPGACGALYSHYTMSAQTQVDVGGILRPQGRLDATPLAPYRGALDDRSAAHLLRRAGFGGSETEIKRYTGMPVDTAVESLVRFPSTAALPAPSNVFDPTVVLRQYTPQDFRALDKPTKRGIEQSLREQTQASVLSMQVWWLNRMLDTPAPLQEKMAFYFHGHFTSAAVQKGAAATLTYQQNQLFRNYALGNLRELTRAVSQDPAMLIYLDNAANVASHPNENFARELMELYTLGVDHYTEKDVRESARAWTGWQYSRFTGVARFNPRVHDDGVKTFLGQTGNFNGDDIVNIIFAQPQCARFFAGSLLSYFVYNDPEPELIDAVAALLRKHDFELAPVMSAIFRSNVFYSDRAYRALVKTPDRVRGRYVQDARAAAVRRHDRAAAAANGSDTLLAAQRRRLARRRELADQRHDDRSPELPRVVREFAKPDGFLVARHHADEGEEP